MFNYSSLLPFGKMQDDCLKITQSFSLSFVRGGSEPCFKVYMLSSYEGTEVPKIRFDLTVKGQDKPLYQSHNYDASKACEYTRKEWRVPPAYCSEIEISVNITVPEGTVLFVRDFGCAEDSGAREWIGGMRHNAHLGFWGLAPDNTMPAFELAAACGFPACIVVPKVTADGVLVCMHDDKINRTARDKDGNPPKEPILIWDKTYEELSEWEYGSWKNEIYKGAKLPLLSDFFDLCQKTGMRPMFSTHPELTVEQWQQVKDMLKKRGLLKNFHIKSFFMAVLKTAYSVFGDEIDGYTYDVGNWDGTQIEKVLNSGIDCKKCRVGIEVKASECTEEITKAITDAGLFAAVWNVKRREFSEYLRWNSWGVTEITEDFHCSMGLNY